jgi:hypothetical protein
MAINQKIWKTRQTVSVLEGAYLLSGLEPLPASADIAPAAAHVLEEILRFARDGKHFTSHQGQPNAPGDPVSGLLVSVNISFLGECRRVIENGDPPRPKVFQHFTMERGECRAVAEALGLTPEFLVEERAQEAPEQKRAPLSLETPEGTTWQGIRLVIRNTGHTEILEVSGPAGRIGNFMPEEIGFRGRGTRESILWGWLKKFAEYGGEIPTVNEPDYMKADVSRLRGALRGLFPGIEGDPIPWRARAWEPAFSISLSEYHDE